MTLTSYQHSESDEKESTIVQTDTTVYHYCCHVLFNWLLFLSYSRFGQTLKRKIHGEWSTISTG